MSRDLRRDPPLPRLVFGVAIVAAGAIFWLDNIGKIEARDYVEWWPLALIALGLAQLPYRRWIAAAWWLLVGTYFLLPVLGYSRFHLGQILGLWPLLISVGGRHTHHARAEAGRAFVQRDRGDGGQRAQDRRAVQRRP